MEKTVPVRGRVYQFEKHLHGRGEDFLYLEPKTAALETPPRTWRRRRGHDRCEQVFGNTSTDVEKTAYGHTDALDLEKHLHGRGEDPLVYWKTVKPLRNTSTDVEKTGAGAAGGAAAMKHLHGRGEDLTSKGVKILQLETPPRTWRRQRDLRWRPVLHQKHLHGRGEDSKIWH